MFSKLSSSKRLRAKETRLPPTVAETYIGLRSSLGDGVYLMENGDLGITYKMGGIADEILTEKELYAAFTPLQKFLATVSKGLPPHKEDASTVIQVICSQRIVTKGPKDLTAENDAGSLIKQEMASLLQSGLIHRDFLLTVRWSPKRDRLNLGKFVQDNFSVLPAFLWVKVKPSAMKQDGNSIVSKVAKASSC